jgi:hypothetical protein
MVTVGAFPEDSLVVGWSEKLAAYFRVVLWLMRGVSPLRPLFYRV